MKLEKLNPLSAGLKGLYNYLFYDAYRFHFYSPEAIGVWALSSGERPKEKIQ